MSVPEGFSDHDLARLMSRLIQCDECWWYDGYAADKGYPYFEWGGRVGHKTGMVMPVHRLAYILFRGPIPTGLHIDHLCRVRMCWNPDHLEAVTPGENARRALTKTHCLRGHLLVTRPNGRRDCQICRRELAHVSGSNSG